MYIHEHEVAIEAVTRAAKLCQAVRAAMVSTAVQEKDDRSPVTIADYGAQALVCQLLREEFPDDIIVGEEDAATLRLPEQASYLDQIGAYVRRWHPDASAEQICGWIDAGHGQVAPRYWTLDPVDGTKGFLRNDQYTIALALVEHGQVKLGVLGCPALPLHLDQPASPLGTLFVALRGQGAWMRAIDGGAIESIQVAPATTGPHLRFAESVEAGHSDQATQQQLARAVGITAPPLRMDSQAKYGVVARGDAALYLRLPSPKAPDYRENIWDHAAGSIIIEEAGGCVTDIFGRPLDFAHATRMHTNRGVIVSNAELHTAVLTALEQGFSKGLAP